MTYEEFKRKNSDIIDEIAMDYNFKYKEEGCSIVATQPISSYGSKACYIQISKPREDKKPGRITKKEWKLNECESMEYANMLANELEKNSK